MRYILPSALLAVLMMSGGTQAAEVQVTVRGTIVGTSCTIVNNFSGNGKSVDLGRVGAAVLGTSNASWVWNSFTIGFERCPVGMTRATITFSGEVDPDNDLYFKNTAVAGGGQNVAQNVAVQLAPATGNELLSNGQHTTAIIDSNTHKGEFPLRARMITPLGRATEGKVAAHLDFTLDYQ